MLGCFWCTSLSFALMLWAGLCVGGLDPISTIHLPFAYSAGAILVQSTIEAMMEQGDVH